MDQYGKFADDIHSGKIVAAYVPDRHGVVPAVSKMAFGNGMGVKICTCVDKSDLFAPGFGDIIAEVPADKVDALTIEYKVIGEVTDDAAITYGDMTISLADAVETWKAPLEKVFASVAGVDAPTPVEEKLYNADSIYVCKNKIAKPTVFIPVFPGTNCEYDSARAVEKAGAEAEIFVIRNLTAEDVARSVEGFSAKVRESQMIFIPGGFSGGDEPDGSAKFITAFFRNPAVKEAVTDLLDNRDGLMCGICNGFQALIKLGLVPYGKIIDTDENCPTLTFNTINRHQSKLVRTRVASNKSPWLKNTKVDEIYTVPISHGEGRFVAPAKVLQELFDNGQVFTQYVDENGQPTMVSPYNPNGSMCAIEGIVSKDGRVLGKMAHSERQGENRNKNIYGEMDQKLFEAGVNYFKKAK